MHISHRIAQRIAHRFWPADRKLFRRRSRLRGPVLAAAAMVLVALAVAVGHSGWA